MIAVISVGPPSVSFFVIFFLIDESRSFFCWTALWERDRSSRTNETNETNEMSEMNERDQVVDLMLGVASLAVALASQEARRDFYF